MLRLALQKRTHSGHGHQILGDLPIGSQVASQDGNLKILAASAVGDIDVASAIEARLACALLGVRDEVR